MFFNEIYGAYYNAVSKILAKAVEKTVIPKDIRKIVEESAFGESSIILKIPFSMKNGSWSQKMAIHRWKTNHHCLLPRWKKDG